MIWYILVLAVSTVGIPVLSSMVTSHLINGCKEPCMKWVMCDCYWIHVPYILVLADSVVVGISLHSPWWLLRHDSEGKELWRKSVMCNCHYIPHVDVRVYSLCLWSLRKVWPNCRFSNFSIICQIVIIYRDCGILLSKGVGYTQSVLRFWSLLHRICKIFWVQVPQNFYEVILRKFHEMIFLVGHLFREGAPHVVSHVFWV